jgi:hypothetical protein
MISTAILLIMLIAQPPVFTACRMESVFVPDYHIEVQQNRFTTWTITRWFDENGHHHMRLKVCDPNNIKPNGCVSWEMIVK